MGWILKENVILNQWISEFYLSCVWKVCFPVWVMFDKSNMSVLWQRLICRKQIFVNNMLVGMCVRPKWEYSFLYLHNKFVHVAQLSAQVFLKNLLCNCNKYKRDLRFLVIFFFVKVYVNLLRKYLFVKFFHFELSARITFTFCAKMWKFSCK